MKKLILVLMAVLIAGTAFAAKVEGPGTAKLIATEISDRDDEVCFSFEGEGADVVLVSGPLSGSIYEVAADFTMLLEGVNFTWASDFMVIFANEDLSEIYGQIGGYSDFGATVFSITGWNGAGNAGAAGTPVVSTVDLGGSHDITGMYMFIGNGYASGGNNIWEGCVNFHGDAVGTVDTNFGSMKAMFR
ncbi:MAG: hypothetical protein GY780_03795 [bacterium]|nr:hypothetical protein [bacterium]